MGSLALCRLLPSLGTSIANVALPTLSQAFHASFQSVQWVVLADLLSSTTLIVSVGQLGDLTGRRRLLLAGIGLFTLAAALCSAAPSLGWLVAARSAQGPGAARMMALALAFVGETVPKGHEGRTICLLGAMSAVGTALGPSLGGVLTPGFGWRAIFLVLVPFGGLTLFFASRGLPRQRLKQRTDRPAFDGLGMLLLALTLAAYTLAMTTGRGHFGPLNLTLLGAAVFSGSLLVVAERRAAFPLLQLELFHDVTLGSSLALSALVSTVMMATLVVGPFYLARPLGLETAQVGLVLASGALVAAVSGVPAGRLADRFGAKRITVIGLVGMAAGSTALSMVPVASGTAGYLAPLLMTTGSYALFQTANNAAVMAEVHPGRRGVISGLLNLSRNLGLITGASGMDAVFALTVAGDTASASPELVATGMHVTFAVAAA